VHFGKEQLRPGVALWSKRKEQNLCGSYPRDYAQGQFADWNCPGRPLLVKVPANNRLYGQANATLDPALRKEIAYQMQQIDFSQGGYIIPAFADTLDAYSAHVTGWTPSGVGQPVNDLDFAALAFTT
jgi:hypothetical protein